jgi:integrase
MAKKAEPYKEGSGWSLRRRVFGQDFYVSGQPTKGAAEKAMQRLLTPLSERGKPKGLGPRRTTLAQALQDMACERLPFMKGAAQEARRVNVYLRAAGLATLKVSKCVAATDLPHDDVPSQAADERQYFEVTLAPATAKRAIPRGLSTHRQTQACETARADALRERLAGMKVCDIQPYHVQELMDELRKAREPATLGLERALLRSSFNYMRHVWRWSEPDANPAVALRMPKVDNGRDRVMSADEQQRLDAAIQECRNELVGPTTTLLTETAMRSGEPLEYARWRDVDWQNNLLKLRDSKNQKRDVPLSPKAIEALRQLATLNPAEPDAHIVQMSYEALKAAWKRACERAGVEDLRLHDLRHTAATRMALKTGNAFLVKALTGLRTMSQVARYVNVKASDVVAVLHASPAGAPTESTAGTFSTGAATLDKAQPVRGVERAGDNVVQVNFGPRRVA